MPAFRYTAVTSGGDRVAGVLSGASEQAVLAELESRKLVPVKLSEERSGSSVFRARIGQARLGVLYGQMSDLLRAGVPLLRALRLLSKTRSSATVRRVFQGLADDVAEGEELATAMESQAGAFPEIHVAMVRAGEKGGFLEDVLANLSDLLQRQADMRAQLLGNMLYPAVLLSVGAGGVLLILRFMVPKFRDVFSVLEEKGQLPGLTKFVLGLGDVVTNHGVLLVVGAVVGLVGLWWLGRRASVRRFLAVAQLRLPVIGPLVRAWCTARLCRVLGTLLANAIPMLTAMRISRDAAGHPLLAEAVDRATESVRQGESLAGPLRESGMIQEDIIEMIDVGESANNLERVLLGVAETLERRIERMLGVAVRLVEPVLLLVIGGIVALLALSFLLPLSKMGSLAG